MVQSERHRSRFGKKIVFVTTHPKDTADSERLPVKIPEAENH